MKKSGLIWGLFACLLLFTACGKSEGNNEQKETIEIVGSSSVEPLITGLSDQYQVVNPAITFFIQAPGSSTGIRAAIDDTADIGMSSRELTEEEQDNPLYVLPIAKDGIVIIVNQENQVDDLSMEQLRQIFSGEITNWKELGGVDRPILLISRESGSGTRDAFDESIGIMDGKRSLLAVDQAIFCDSTNSVSQNVSDKGNAIGYVSLGSLLPDVKAVSIDGVVCSEENILSETYPLSRPFDLLINEERWKQEDERARIEGFLQYIASDAGKNYVSAKGFIPTAMDLDSLGG